MAEIDEFIETLIDAFMGRQPERRIIGLFDSQRAAVLAVARVALERAAEVAKVQVDDKTRWELPDGRERFVTYRRDKTLSEAIAAIRALIPAEKETI